MNTDEIFSTSFQAGKRTYFLDIKKTKEGDKYLKISENKRINETVFVRHQIMVFEEGIEKFIEVLNQTANKIRKSEKTYSLNEIRKVSPKAYALWTIEDDNLLESLLCKGKKISELSKIFERKEGAIRSRIKKLELNDKYDKH